MNRPRRPWWIRAMRRDPRLCPVLTVIDVIGACVDHVREVLRGVECHDCRSRVRDLELHVYIDHGGGEVR